MTTTTNTTLTWEAGDIFEANLMFPTEHIKDADTLNGMSDEEFSDFSIGLLDPIQPLNTEAQKQLARSVFSSNRLRIYYHILKLLDTHLKVVDETTQQGCEGSKLKEEFDHHNFQVVDIDQLTQPISDPEDDADRFLSENG